MGVSVIAALALGLGLRLWFVVHTARVAGDSLIYGDIAKTWMQTGVYGFGQGGGGALPTLIRLPGYPMFLAASFRLFGMEHYTAVMYAQSLIDLVTCLLVGALAGRLFGHRAGLAALWLAALCPFTASYAAYPLAETLTLTCIALAFYALERWRASGLGFNRWLWVVTGALAYALLLRPEQGLLAAAVVPAMLWMALRPERREGAARAAAPVLIAAVCVVLPLIPWTVRNWRTFHVVQPLAPRYATDPGEPVPLGFQHWFKTWGIEFASTEDVYWNYDGDMIDLNDLPTRAFDTEDQYMRTAELIEEYNHVARANPAFDARFEELAQERVQNDPIRYYVALPVARVLDMILRPRVEMFEIELQWWRWRDHPKQTLFAGAYAALNLGYFALAGFGLWRWYRRGWNGNKALAFSMIGFIVLRTMLLLTLDNSEPRYTLEFFPVLIIWAGAVFSDFDCNGRLL
jgi:4-amino-4-deoxy-L-arabinose transferase-like glycosyltransferase